MSEPNLATLEKKLGVTFKNKDLLRRALIHRSYLNEDPKSTESNERLEFLGDSVLSLITSRFIYEKFPADTEGQLTATRSRLVQTKTLAQIAQSLELGTFLKMSKGEEMSGGRNNLSLLADTFEAVLGATFLDQGLVAASKIVKSHLLSQLDQVLTSREMSDYKSKLQELVQQREKTSPNYQVIRSEGPDHAKTFYMEVVVTDHSLGQGMGHSKQEAEQMAAKDALERLEKAQYNSTKL